MHRLFYFELPSASIKNRLAVFSSSCGMLLRRAAVQPLETPALSRTATISSGDRTVARTGPGGHVGRVFVAMGRTVHCLCFLQNMWTPKLSADILLECEIDRFHYFSAASLRVFWLQPWGFQRFILEVFTGPLVPTHIVGVSVTWETTSKSAMLQGGNNVLNMYWWGGWIIYVTIRENNATSGPTQRAVLSVENMTAAVFLSASSLGSVRSLWDELWKDVNPIAGATFYKDLFCCCSHLNEHVCESSLALIVRWHFLWKCQTETSEVLIFRCCSVSSLRRRTELLVSLFLLEKKTDNKSTR